MRYSLYFLIMMVIFPLMTQAAEERGLQIVTIQDQAGQDVGLYQESHALVIGVSEYTEGWSNLPGVKEDVRA